MLGLSRTSGASVNSTSIKDSSSASWGSASRFSLWVLVVLAVVLCSMGFQPVVIWRGYGVSCDLINLFCKCSTGKQTGLRAPLKCSLVVLILCSYCEDAMLIACCGNVGCVQG